MSAAPHAVAEMSPTSESKPTCPRCHASTWQRSRIRWYELWRKAISTRRPFRCTTCRHRVWIEVPPQEPAPSIEGFELPTFAGKQPNLSALDAAVVRRAAATGAGARRVGRAKKPARQTRGETTDVSR